MISSGTPLLIPGMGIQLQANTGFLILINSLLTTAECVERVYALTVHCPGCSPVSRGQVFRLCQWADGC